MANAELIYEEVKTLPEDYTVRVLDFVKHIKQEKDRKAEIDKLAEEAGDSWFERGEPCPVCAKLRDPVTGNPRYNAETVAAIEEGKAMMRGEIPAKRYNSLEEMLVDLDADD